MEELKTVRQFEATKTIEYGYKLIEYNKQFYIYIGE